MSIFLKLLGWTGLPQWAIELLAIAAIVAGLYFAGMMRERTIVQTRVVKQEVQVEKRIVTTDHSYDKELADLRAYRAAHPPGSVRLCLPDRLPAPPVARSTRSPSPDIHAMPGGDSSLRPRNGPDIGSLLGLLAQRADEVSATLRRRQEIEP